jgi:hypothetical protein
VSKTTNQRLRSLKTESAILQRAVYQSLKTAANYLLSRFQTNFNLEHFFDLFKPEKRHKTAQNDK